MKLILAQPAIPRFQWELDVLLANIRQFTDLEVVLLFTEHDFTVPQHFRDAGHSVFTYSDLRDDTDYIPSVRPWLLWQYLRGDPAREQEDYFYIDSDVIFRDWPDFTTFTFDEHTVTGSDCSGYLSLDYVLGCEKGQEIAAQMAAITSITVEQMQGVPGIGAHLLLTNPTAAFWERAYNDSNKIHHYFQGIDSNIQKWTAEMWAQLWGWVREGIKPVATDELKFCLPTDDIARWDEVKILHNAGIQAEMSHEYFFKGQYVNYSPLGKNFDYVRADKCTIRYVEALKKVLQ